MFGRKFDKTSEEVRNDLNNEDVILLDVREIDEYENGHIPGAVWLALSEVEAKAEELLDKEKQLYVYCRSGQRSASAVRKLKALGYTHAYNIGGIIQWPYEVKGGRQP